MVDYKRAFAAIRTDPQWKRKIGLGVLIALIPYVGAVWMLGWEMEYQRSVAWGDDERIPDWSGFSRQALLGLKAYIAILPYSLVLSVIITPLMFIGVAFVASADVGSGSALLGVGVGLGMGFVVMVFSLLLVPLTASVMLRVSIYGTLESGFQFKEIWRLMREHRAELVKAWGYTALNVGISLAVTVLYFGVALGLALLLLPGSSEEGIFVIIAVGSLGYIAYWLLALALSLYLGLANMHHFGSFGRVAYDLDRAREHYNPAVTGRSATFLPDTERPA